MGKERIVIATSDKLHFYNMDAEYVQSVTNNLFQRFPLVFLSDQAFVYVSEDTEMADPDRAVLKKLHVGTGDTQAFTEFPVKITEGEEKGGPSYVFLGLTPQVKVAFDENSGKMYCGRSDRYEITVTDPGGSRIGQFSLERHRKAFTEKEKRKYFTNPRRTPEQTEAIIASLPDALTYYMRIQVNEGLVYIFAVDEFTRTQNIQHIDIFSLHGEYLYRGRIRFGEDLFFRNAEQLVVRDEHLYVILSDAQGKSRLAKYKIDLPPSPIQQDRSPGQEFAIIPEISTEKVEKMIDVGGRQLHACVYGRGFPAVVLVSGFNAPQIYWNSIVPEIAKHTTVVTYDRAGYGKSELGNLPCDGRQTAVELYSLLEKMEVPGPYVLVGHSYGGKIVRLFASLYPEDMAGLILEDSSHEGLREAQRDILKGKDLEMLESRILSMSGSVEKPITELECLELTLDQLRNSPPLPQIPLTVLTAGMRPKPPGFSPEGGEKIWQLGFDYQKKYLELIPGGKHTIVEGVGHNMHVEKPECVIDPILEMLRDIRRKGE